MASKREYLDYILEQLSDLDEITYRMMMGEYIVYYKGKIASYLCDNKMLVRPVPAVLKLIENPIYEPPYEGAKDMILVEETDNREFLTELFISMYDELPFRKSK